MFPLLAPGPSFTLDLAKMSWMDAEAICGTLVNLGTTGKQAEIEQYITTLYQLIETCKYGTLKDELLRDRCVVGIRDTALSEKLQMDATLTLDRAKLLIRQKEAVKEQHNNRKRMSYVEDIDDDKEEAAVDAADAQ